eukprot:gene4318-4571_t
MAYALGAQLKTMTQHLTQVQTQLCGIQIFFTLLCWNYGHPVAVPLLYVASRETYSSTYQKLGASRDRILTLAGELYLGRRNH